MKSRKEFMSSQQLINISDSISVYLKDIGKFKLLTAEEEVELANMISMARKSKNDEIFKKSLEARDQLILSNLRLVVSIAKKYAYTNIPMMDLIQEGSMGLMKAIDLFEVRKGYRLSTYATWWIRQFISRSIPNTSRTIRIPVYVYESLFAIHKAKQQYFIEHGFELDIKTLSNITNIAVDTLKIIVLCSDDAISLDQPIRDDDYNSLIDFTQDKYNLNPDELYKAKMLDEFVLNIINVLDEREQAIIKMRFGIECDEKTLEEIGKNYNISKERVRQIQKRAIDKLRDHLAKLSDEYIYFYDTN